VRQARSRPILEAFRPWLELKLSLVSGKATIAEVIRYTLARWDGLCRFFDDGRIEVDNNTVERQIRPITLGRKNLFAGSDGGGEHWAVLASLIATCKLNSVDTQAYLADVLTKIVNRHPVSRSTKFSPSLTSSAIINARPWPENAAYPEAASRQLHGCAAGARRRLAQASRVQWAG
jgi:transposase